MCAILCSVFFPVDLFPHLSFSYFSFIIYQSVPFFFFHHFSPPVCYSYSLYLSVSPCILPYFSLSWLIIVYPPSYTSHFPLYFSSPFFPSHTSFLLLPTPSSSLLPHTSLLLHHYLFTVVISLYLMRLDCWWYSSSYFSYLPQSLKCSMVPDPFQHTFCMSSLVTWHFHLVSSPQCLTIHLLFLSNASPSILLFLHSPVQPNPF